MVAPSREAREAITLSSWQPHLGHRIILAPHLIVAGLCLPYQILRRQDPPHYFFEVRVNLLQQRPRLDSEPKKAKKPLETGDRMLSQRHKFKGCLEFLSRRFAHKALPPKHPRQLFHPKNKVYFRPGQTFLTKRGHPAKSDSR